MALRGSAFIAIWHDLAPGFEQSFERWHTEEHMPERLGVPGFLLGARYMNWQQPRHVCFTRYELSRLEVFRSPAYLARLNAPTAWSQRIQPGMTNFIRGACANVLSLGGGMGGAVSTMRLCAGDGGAQDLKRGLCEAALDAVELPGITSVDLGEHAAQLSDPQTREAALRPAAPQASFDFVLLIEAISRKALEPEADRLARRLQACAAAVEVGCYELAFALEGPRG